MSDALPLPPRPNLERYKKLAKSFQRVCRSANAGAIREWAAHWAESLDRLHGIAITAEVRKQIDVQAGAIERQWRSLQSTEPAVAQCTLSGAQLVIARGHGFASWTRFAGHLEALGRADSRVAKFEAAADAVADGDLVGLAKLLRENPELVHARSTREHHSTLLHYVAANGVEDFRQKMPENIVEIARLLVGAGADVNAESGAYGGRATVLGLTATSCHPEKAGVQIPLMELLISFGAHVDSPDGTSAVNSCLRNGRGQAAEFLANRGAQLDLEGAAGVGRLDIVKSFFSDGRLQAPATLIPMRDGFGWACEFGRNEVVAFLLKQGVDPGVGREGQTGLHWAALGGHAETVQMLLDRGAPVDAKDARYGGTPLGWALYAWSQAPVGTARQCYYDVVARLVRAGSKLEPAWPEDARADARMQAALRGETV